MSRSPQPPGGRPLSGIRILELGQAIAGPFATLLLAGYGAQVIKVESRYRMDTFRRRHGSPEYEKSHTFGDFNRNKLDITLNLKTKQGCEIVRRLVGISDVVVENFSARVMPGLGLDYASLAQVKPDLIMVSTQAFGSSGPQSQDVGWGPGVMAFTGMFSLWNEPDGEQPVGSQIAHADYLSALHCAFAVLAALRYRDRTGEGQYVEVAQTESLAAVLGPFYLDYLVNENPGGPIGNSDPAVSPHGCYRCAGDDEWCVIVAETEAQWLALLHVTGHPEWARDPRYATVPARLLHRQALDRDIEAWTSNSSKADVVERLQAAGVPAEMVQNGQDLFGDPHLRARDFVETTPHPEMGNRSYAQLPVRWNGRRFETWRSAPLLGEDTEYVCRELLGLSAAEIQALVEAEVLA